MISLEDTLYPIIIWVLAITGALLAFIGIVVVHPRIQRKKRRGKSRGRHK